MRILLTTILLSLLAIPVTAGLDSIQPLQLEGTRRTFCTSFSIDEKAGLWATAGHCIAVMKEREELFTVGGYEATEVFVDYESDIAVVISKAHAKAFELAAVAPKVGDSVVVMGFPYGLPSLVTTTGKIAAQNIPLGRWGPVYILDVTVAGGNSGSPVLKGGKVVGVLVAKFVASEHSVSTTWETTKRLIGTFYGK